MFQGLRQRLLKKLYRRLVLRVIILSSESCKQYLDLKPFCTLDVETNHGTFVFSFKEDRRIKKRNPLRGIVKNFLVELTPPEGLGNIQIKVEHSIVLVIKVLFFKINYKALVGVLTETYLDVSLGLR